MLRRILVLSACAGAAILATPAAHADPAAQGRAAAASAPAAPASDPLTGLLGGLLGGLLSIGR
ncbi:MAG: hypothetical protein DIU60_008545 [Actinomycetes bacterium]|jgi:hypothetical protein|nr:MAG: hypothetical protein DIU60_03675 [Actinomycetota bacterium]